METECPSSNLLTEFCTALREEIETARRNSSSNAVSLTNGRKIAQVGTSYQYVFTVESILNLPGDAPGDLFVQGHLPVEATIISTEGLTITISVPVDLGPFISNARLQNDLTILMRKLIERIEQLSESENPAGSRILGTAEVHSYPIQQEVPRRRLNDEQYAALLCSLSRDLTFIWGPPGTGKTETIGAIGEHLYRRGRSVLLVSHTNVAVDQALLKIADAFGMESVEGHVIRVGDPKDKRLFNAPYSALLLRTQVEKRSAELITSRSSIETERTEKGKELSRLQRIIGICEWVEESQPDIEAMSRELAQIQDLDSRADGDIAIQRKLIEDSPKWERVVDQAGKAKGQIDRVEYLMVKLEELDHGRAERGTQCVGLQHDLEEAQKVHAQSLEIAPLREELQGLPIRENLRSWVEQWRDCVREANQAFDSLSTQLDESEAVYERTISVTAIMRLWRKLPKPEEQLAVVEWLRGEHNNAKDYLVSQESQLGEVVQALDKVQALQERLQPYSDIPQCKDSTKVVEDLEHQLRQLEYEKESIDGISRKYTDERNELSKEIDVFKRTYGGTPDNLLSESKLQLQKLDEVKARLGELDHERIARRHKLEVLLKERLETLRQWSLCDEVVGSSESMLSAIQEAHRHASEQVADADVEALHIRSVQINERIREIDSEIQKIEEDLKRVEELVISDATIIATTLTRAYLRDSIQSRRFDTVILDEASMAPIPALWIAASLANKNVVVVGDFYQLPPIVQSNHDLAQKWLGRDIFETSGMRKAKEENKAPEYFISLCLQYRMHPDISRISNKLIYRTLKDAKPVEESSAEQKLGEWYRHDWGYDNPVLLVDTASTGAWVTSVVRGASGSRLNFLSATICVDLAEQLLRNDREKLDAGDQHRILIVCPYRPHAKFLNLLINEQKLNDEVVAGTAHSFQGSEADIVILDLVVDKPHWRVNLFMPKNDFQIKRLFNVALTRARRRLIIVGNFDYCLQRSKRAFLDGELVPFLVEQYKRVDALEVIPTGLAGRAANMQSTTFGGDVESDATRLVVTQVDFYRVLLADIGKATKRVVIYSPYLTQNRVAALELQVKAAIERGVRVYIITKTYSERSNNEVAIYRMIENSLTSWGAIIIHKLRMHEKLVIIDDGTLWSGSLNPLSFSNTQEIMERRLSKKVVSDYVETLRLEDLVGVYDAGEDECPLCKSQLIPAEGADQPFYWRCEDKDCDYSRSIDQPPPVNGFLVCPNCSGSLQYGEWGGKPHWRCEYNPRHRQRIFRNHLKLPKMLALVPKKELRKLCKFLGIEPLNQRRSQGKEPRERFARESPEITSQGVVLTCGDCGQKMRVPMMNRDLRVKCPSCKKEFVFRSRQERKDSR